MQQKGGRIRRSNIGEWLKMRTKYFPLSETEAVNKKQEVYISVTKKKFRNLNV